MSTHGRAAAMGTVLIAELFLLGVLILFLRAEGAILTILIPLGGGLCWYLYNKFTAFQTYIALQFQREKAFAGIVALLSLASIPLMLHDVPYLIHLCLIAGIYVMLATGLTTSWEARIS
jgi:hypothetical protein